MSGPLKSGMRRFTAKPISLGNAVSAEKNQQSQPA